MPYGVILRAANGAESTWPVDAASADHARHLVGAALAPLVGNNPNAGQDAPTGWKIDRVEAGA